MQQGGFLDPVDGDGVPFLEVGVVVEGDACIDGGEEGGGMEGGRGGRGGRGVGVEGEGGPELCRGGWAGAAVFLNNCWWWC